MEGPGTGYLRRACDYVHLNPARAKILKKTDRLLAYPWSSFGFYLAAPEHRPRWIRVDRLLGGHGLGADTASAREQFEARMEQRLTGMVNVPGAYQAQAGCAGDWDPACLATQMTKGDDGLWRSGPFNLKAGEYEFKVALDGSWTSNYGSDGLQDGPNYKVTLTADGTIEFVYDPATKLVTATVK